jgi:hypothetical protein
MKASIVISFILSSMLLFSQDTAKENQYMDNFFEYTIIDTAFHREKIERIRYINQPNNTEFYIKFHEYDGIIETGHLKNGIYYGYWCQYNNEGRKIKSLDFDTMLIQSDDILKIAEMNRFDLEIYKIDYIFDEPWSDNPLDNHWTITEAFNDDVSNTVLTSGISVCSLSGKQYPYGNFITYQPARSDYDSPPMFDENSGSLEEFIILNSQYRISERPKAKNAVPISFEVTAKGELRNISTGKANTGYFKREAKRIVEIMPNWIPATKDGHAVECSYHVISINFD